MRRLVGIVLLTFLAVGVLYDLGKEDAAEKGAVQAAVPAPPREPDPWDRIAIEITGWSLGGFDNVALVSGKVKNANPYAVKDVTLRCSFMGASGTIVSRQEHTLYQRLAPDGSYAFKKVNLGFVNPQSKRMSCAVLYADRAG